jgi:hypothetical protein
MPARHVVGREDHPTTPGTGRFHCVRQLRARQLRSHRDGPNTTTTDELGATMLLCRNDLAYAPSGRMGLFGLLVAALGIV